MVLDEARDAGREHACLTGAHSGEHQHGTFEMEHCFPLRRIETGEWFGPFGGGDVR